MTVIVHDGGSSPAPLITTPDMLSVIVEIEWLTSNTTHINNINPVCRWLCIMSEIWICAH